MAEKEYLTTGFGIPVSDNQHSLTAGNPGPTLLEDFHLVENLVGHMHAANRETQERQVSHFYKADPDYGRRIARGLGIELKAEAEVAK